MEFICDIWEPWITILFVAIFPRTFIGRELDKLENIHEMDVIKKYHAFVKWISVDRKIMSLAKRVKENHYQSL